MKLLIKVGFAAVLAAAWIAKPSFADHSEPRGSINALAAETQELEANVRYAYLRYEVQVAVAEFNRAVQSLQYCASPYGNGNVAPAHCRGELGRVRMCFQEVERYLYDTNYSYPLVYRNYFEVRATLANIRVVAPPPPNPYPPYPPYPPVPPRPVTYQCVATPLMRPGRASYAALGRTIQEARMRALQRCQLQHNNCVAPESYCSIVR